MIDKNGSDPRTIKSPPISASNPTIKFFAIAAPPFTCNVPVLPVDDVTVAVPKTVKPEFTIKSCVGACDIPFYFLKMPCRF